jgi:hypothetical protein
LAASGIIFILTSGGILLGALLRRTLPRHHLNEHAKDVVRLGDHVVFAIGRDYADVAPIDGVIYASGGQRLEVSVGVTPVT